MFRFACLLALPLALPFSIAATALAQSDFRNAERMRYQSCIAMTGEAPGDALQEAQTWGIEGGGWPADVCEAQALIALGDHAVGAAILEELAAEPPAGMVDEERVDFLTLAAESRARMRDHEAALVNFTAALALDPSAILTRTGRARLNAETGDWAAVGRDANALIDRAPELAIGWHMRALYNLETGNLSAAWSDIEAAREREPDRIETLVLRGRINEARRLSARPTSPR